MRVGLFPGQGIDKEAVLAGLPEDHARVAQAGATLGIDLRREVARHPRKTLPTKLAQPAILTAGVIAHEDAVAAGQRFDFLLGHSLGEYTALVASGAIPFGDGLRLVACRAAAMARAALARPGGMAAVIGLGVEDVEAVARASATVVANDNSPQEVVLSGDETSLARAADLVAAAGGRSVRLRVEGAFHSPAMAPALPALEEALVQTSIRTPPTPVLSNVAAARYKAPGEIRSLLLEQLTGRIRFRSCVERLRMAGAEEFVDLGPGNVAGRLARATARPPKTEVAHA